MTRVKIANYAVVNGRGYWQAKAKMRALGFQSMPCGPDGPDAWAKAAALNAAWKRARQGLPAYAAAKGWARGSIGDAFDRFRRTQTWANKAPRTREDWERRWKLLAPVFGALDPSTLTFEDLDAFYWALVASKGVHEAFHTLKVWRALWVVMASLGFCEASADPSKGIRRETPRGRKQVWREGEAVRLVKRSIRTGYLGLACCIAVAWDTQFSPVDVRQLSGAHLVDAEGRKGFAGTTREKTGAAVIGTISARTERLVTAYVASLGADQLPSAPLFRNRSGRAYSKDTMGDDFRDVRALEFGDADDRTMMDMRRSGAVEASAGGVNPTHLAAKMGTTINSSAALQKTYLPVDAASVRGADDARRLGRRRTRDNT